jgi:putative membrane protein
MRDVPGRSTAHLAEERISQEEIGRRLVYFSAERTLMAWVRASLGSIAVGFVIDRFGLVFRQFLPTAGARFFPKSFSFLIGEAFVLFGVLLALVAAARYYRFSRDYLRTGSTEPRHGISIGVLFTVILALLGCVIIVFLVIATD